MQFLQCALRVRYTVYMIFMHNPTMQSSDMYSVVKPILEPHVPLGDTSFCFRSRQSDTSLQCETTDTELVHYVVYV